MNRIFKTITACALALVMSAISPMTDLSSRAAETDGQSGQLYISDIKIGNAYVDGEANPDKGMKDEAAVAAELESEGYTILRDGNAYANLNDGAGSKSGLKKGANHKIILFGYKTTTNPNDAITDLAVMNMNGGYSVQDYESLLETQMNSHIKPFVDRFITTINEYRENIKKPEDTINHKRAETSRQLLNMFTDDDTGGQPVGDLLLNKTKYEMGDAAYDKLSDEEKKNHADILTMLLQGNAQVILSIETLLSKATDTAEDTWLDRMLENNVEALVQQIKEENPSLKTKKDIYAALDRKYMDTAKQLQSKWKASVDLFLQSDDLEEEAIDSIKDREETEVNKGADEIEDLDDLDNSVDALTEGVKEYTDVMTDTMKLRISALAAYLETIQYGEGTLLDYFRGEGEYKARSNGFGIRTLYPMAAALSDGQREGLEFLSVIDLLTIAVDDGESADKSLVEDQENTSVYDGVNRETFKPGGVAMTSDALRAQANSNAEEDDPSIASVIRPSTWALWGLTFISTVGATVSKVIAKRAADKLTSISESISANTNRISELKTIVKAQTVKIDRAQTILSDPINRTSHTLVKNTEKALKAAQEKIEEAGNEMRSLSQNNNDLTELQGQLSNTNYNAYFYAFMGVAVVLLVVSTWRTLVDISDSYDTEFLPIPLYMVDEVDITSYNEKGERIFVNNQTAYYKVVTCNRVDGDSDIEKQNHETMLDRNDLNGDVGRQWLSLYYVKNKNACPILADSLLYRKGGGSMPSGYSTGIHEFGSKTAANLNKKSYLFAEEPPAIHVFYKNTKESAGDLVSVMLAGNSKAGDDGEDPASDAPAGEVDSGDAEVAGTITSKGTTGGSGVVTGIAIGGGIGIVLGALLMALIMYLSRRKKVAVVEADEKIE